MNRPVLAAYCHTEFGPGNIGSRIDDARGSGFNTLVLWAMHIGRAGIQQPWGELVFNDGNIRIVDGAVFNPDKSPDIAAWPGNLAKLKKGGSVEKLFISIGGQGGVVFDFTTIEHMLENGMTNVLRENFTALRNSFTVDGQCMIDGVDIDNEEDVKPSTIVDFCSLLFELGFEVTFCPFSNPAQWQGYMQALWDKGHRVSGWNLQCYSGGGGNLSILKNWVDSLSAVVGEGQGAAYLIPGLAVQGATDSTPKQCPCGEDGMLASLGEAAAAIPGLGGAFVWSYDYVLQNTCACGDTVPKAADYAKALRSALDGPSS